MAGWLMVWAVLAVSTNADQCEFEREVWSDPQVRAPCAVEDFEAEWNLDAKQAACARTAARIVPRTREQKPGLHAAWRACVQQFPAKAVFWHAFFDTWENTDESMSVLRLLPTTAVDAGKPIADALLDVHHGPVGAIAAVIAERTPSRLVELLQDQRLRDTARFTLALSTPAGREPEAVNRALLRWTLTHGHPMWAAELWLRLPETLRREWTTTDQPWLHGEQGMDLRAVLALGLIALGKKDAARALSLPAESKQPLETLLLEIVDWHLTGKRCRSAWDAAIEARELDGWELWVAVLPFVRPHEALVLRGFSFREAWQRKDRATRGGDYVPSVQRQLDAWDDRALAVLKQQVAFDPAVLDARPEVAMAGTDASPFTETSSKPKCGSCRPLNVSDVQAPGFHVVRAQRVGTRRVALALSQRLDPVGEVSHGAYWLLVAESERAHFREIYLGLGDYRPFHALETSDVPLLDEADVVRLAMADVPLDEASIRFPPVATQTTARRARVVLEALLAQVAADQDHDGLSDVVERRLLLDPMKADTDGDGVKDGDDATPRLDDRLPVTRLAEMYNAFFEHQSGRSLPRAIVTAPGKDAVKVEPRDADLDDVVFLEGSPEGLAGLRTLKRVITLTSAEYAAARQRFGAFYPMDVRVVLNGNDHAFVEWNEGWRGGTLRIDRQPNGALKITSLSSWIT